MDDRKRLPRDWAGLVTHTEGCNMTAMIGLPREHDWTIADLADQPDDGMRYELVDGVLLVDPTAGPVVLARLSVR